MLISGHAPDVDRVAPVHERVKLRGLSDQELQAAHHRAQVDSVFSSYQSVAPRLNAIERELLSRRLPCR